MILGSHFDSKAVAINDADPDDGNDWRCEACLLPIFSTPFVVNQPDGGRMHDQCANKIPERFEDHPLHPRGILVRQNLRGIDIENCFRCKSKCGAMFYKCGGEDCRFTLDLPCALAIKIVHQSHRHELTAMMGSSCPFICSACGTQHDDQPALGKWGLSYVCIPCDFWIHPDCAVLPYAIEVDDKVVHGHPLLLSYGDIGDELWRFLRIRELHDGYNYASDYKSCAVCGGGESKLGLGWYRCFHCKYSVHIKCIVYSHPPPQHFKRVLLRDAKIPGLIHLPMANEHQSVVQRIMNSRIKGDVISKVHQHPLVINQPLLRNNNNNDDDDDRVCNACVQLISPSDAFYSCSSSKVNNSCTNFYLHSCCAQLPATITTRKCTWNGGDHTLPLLVSGEIVGKFPFHISRGGKVLFDYNLHNGFSYFCKECKEYIDVINALMPSSITHDAHAKSHILCIAYHYHRRRELICSCCKRITGRLQIGYECNNCNNFFIHVDCALLPDKVTHDFDQHPLNLITTNHQQGGDEEEEQVALCEICEENLDTGRWFYGCKKCDQSFHVDCIPYFDVHLSKIKLGFTIRVTGHDCPLACVSALSVDGYRCGRCHDVIRESDNWITTGKIAFECAECDYRIHSWPCAKKLLLKGE